MICKIAAKGYERIIISFSVKGIYDYFETVILARARSASGTQKSISMERYNPIAA